MEKKTKWHIVSLLVSIITSIIASLITLKVMGKI
jgi:hypothetical protein